jgi:glycosyltransferase involved in cell wall biosynthesis
MVEKSFAHRVTVVIPSYQPDEKLCRVVKELEEVGFDDIIVINDGSSPEKSVFFPDPSEHPAVTLLEHKVNRGKGAALKTAFAYFLENRPDREGVVTADGDAQHRPSDVLACAEAMLCSDAPVLGARDFSLPHVPRKSRAGNRITSAVFFLLCGLRISDTQTGLRAIPTRFLDVLCEVNGDRYEYETNMLLEMKRLHVSWREQKIETVYIDENQTSHFRPFWDSVRIYSLILKFVFSSGCSAIVDILAFYLLKKFLSPLLPFFPVLIPTVIARTVSSVTNFSINRRVVFRSGESVLKTCLKYYALAIPVMLISAGSVRGLSELIGDDAPAFVTLLKMLVDTVLYFINFRVQREWVFAPKRKK